MDAAAAAVDAVPARLVLTLDPQLPQLLEPMISAAVATCYTLQMAWVVLAVL